MAYHIDKNTNSLVIDGFEKGIAASPYTGIGSMRNLGNTYYPGVAYVNYRRQSATENATETFWFAGTHSTNVSNNFGWTFSAPATPVMTNPVQKATSPVGLNYILDDSGQIWKQTAVNGNTFNILADGAGRISHGAGGLAFWNNYLFVFGAGNIEVCGDGTGDAGIISTNWNINIGSSYNNPATNVTFASQTFQCTGAISIGATTATLNAVWAYPTNAAAIIIFSNGETRTITVTNGSTALSWSGALASGASSLVFISSSALFTTTNVITTKPIIAGNGVVFSSSGGSVPAPLVSGTVYYVTATPVTTSGGYLFSVAATPGGTAIIINDQGSGTLTFSVVSLLEPPIGNISNLTFTTALLSGDTTATIAGYTTPDGTVVAGTWILASGIYNIVDSNGDNILATFTNGSSLVTFIYSIVRVASGTFQIWILTPTATSYRAYVSKVDGNLYFANGRWVGRISVSPNPNSLFYPSVPSSYSVNYSATGTLQIQDTVVDMTDLQGTLIIAGNFDVYPWDYVSAQPSASSPVGEQIYRIANLLNNIYILAGTKGNMYFSNGFSAQLLYKIPDFIAGVLDPIWLFGDLMVHRSKLFFQAIAQTSAGVNVLAGIFSIIVSPSSLGETASGLVMEAQNSYGLTPATGAKQNGILIDNEPWSTGQDSYYSSWSNGAAIGGIDYNDSSGWQNFEPTIEADIIPIGDILNKATLGQIQFKLDRPMVSGDAIRMYWRPSLSDSYTIMGTTTLTQLSDYYNSNVTQSQWAQFKIQMKCASSGSSFIPLREIRIQLK